MSSPILLPEREREGPTSRPGGPHGDEACRAAVESLVAAVRKQVAAEALPDSTYRLQFRGAFTFEDAARIAPYLASLGVTHVYASPYMQATPGSQHGYDLVDPNALSQELGGEDGYRRFIEQLRSAQLGHILDWVPNHMGVGTDRNV